MFMLNAQLHKKCRKKGKIQSAYKVFLRTKSCYYLAQTLFKVTKIYHVSSTNAILNFGWWIVWE